MPGSNRAFPLFFGENMARQSRIVEVEEPPVEPVTEEIT
jgi:hypothetical protein